MSRHVLDVLSRCEKVGKLIVLAAAKPEGTNLQWSQDHGRGLNREISAFRDVFGTAPLLIIHADLPLVSPSDVAALLEAAERHGAALATDRVGHGTNALALRDGRAFEFYFGPRSRFLHSDQDRDMPVLQCVGLSADLDTPEDIDFLNQYGFVV